MILMSKISRRNFLKKSALITAASYLPPVFLKTAEAKESLFEARYYKALDDNEVWCQLCPNECIISHGERGDCDVRENRNGVLYSLVYGKPCTWHADPIEKKPLFHFLPGTLAYSIATAGCNIECKFCQNWQIAQSKPEDIRQLDMPPEEVARNAKSYGCKSIAYTYSEPVIFQEYMIDSAKAGTEKGVRSVMISNGFINEKPMKEVCANLDAVKIDLKAFSNEYYKDICRGELQPVLNTLKLLKQEDVWFEIVYLMVPTLNDDKEELTKMCDWIVENLGEDVPLHFSRFHPQYKLKNLPATPKKTLNMAYEVAQNAGLNYVYVGNVPGHKGESTFCPNCGKAVIKRIGFRVVENNLNDGKCKFCDTEIAGIWK